MGNSFGFDPNAGSDEETDKYSKATLMFQKGLGSLADVAQDKKRLALEQAKVKFEKIQKDRDYYTSQFGNTELSADARLRAYNSMVALDKAVNPSSQMMPMDSWDEVSENLSNDVGVARKMLTDGKIGRPEYHRMILDATAAAYQTAKSKQDTVNIADIEKRALEGVNTSSATVNSGGKSYTGSVNPMTNTMEPYQTPNGPAESPDVPVQQLGLDQQYRGQELEERQRSNDLSERGLDLREGSANMQRLQTAAQMLKSLEDGVSYPEFVQENAEFLSQLGIVNPNKMSAQQLRKTILNELIGGIGSGSSEKPAEKKKKPGQDQESKVNVDLVWNGKQLKDTPANRKWVQEQRSKQKKAGGKNPDVGAVRG